LRCTRYRSARARLIDLPSFAFPAAAMSRRRGRSTERWGGETTRARRTRSSPRAGRGGGTHMRRRPSPSSATSRSPWPKQERGRPRKFRVECVPPGAGAGCRSCVAGGEPGPRRGVQRGASEASAACRVLRGVGRAARAAAPGGVFAAVPGGALSKVAPGRVRGERGGTVERPSEPRRELRS
jgi:hypothetical protein